LLRAVAPGRARPASSKGHVPVSDDPSDPPRTTWSGVVSTPGRLLRLPPSRPRWPLAGGVLASPREGPLALKHPGDHPPDRLRAVKIPVW